MEKDSVEFETQGYSLGMAAQQDLGSGFGFYQQIGYNNGAVKASVSQVSVKHNFFSTNGLFGVTYDLTSNVELSAMHNWERIDLNDTATSVQTMSYGAIYSYDSSWDFSLFADSHFSEICFSTSHYF